MPVTRRDVLDGGFHLLKPIDVGVVDPQLALELCQFATVLFKRLMSTGITVVFQRRNGRLSAFPAFLKEGAMFDGCGEIPCFFTQIQQCAIRIKEGELRIFDGSGLAFWRPHGGTPNIIHRTFESHI